jgi:hypothetical protein
MRQKNLLNVCPIIVRKKEKKLEILDGQGRFEAAKMLKLPIHYVITNDFGDSFIGEFNSTSTKWSMRDYIEWYANKGKKDYIELRKFCDETKIMPSTALSILTGITATDSGQSGNQNKIKSDFHDGKFKITDMENGIRVAKVINILKRHGIKHATHRGVVVAISKLKNRLNSKLEYQSTKFVKCADYHQYISLIDEIYNFKAGRSQIVSLVTEVKKL